MVANGGMYEGGIVTCVAVFDSRLFVVSPSASSESELGGTNVNVSGGYCSGGTSGRDIGLTRGG